MGGRRRRQRPTGASGGVGAAQLESRRQRSPGDPALPSVSVPSAPTTSGEQRHEVQRHRDTEPQSHSPTVPQSHSPYARQQPLTLRQWRDRLSGRCHHCPPRLDALQATRHGPDAGQVLHHPPLTLLSCTPPLALAAPPTLLQPHPPAIPTSAVQRHVRQSVIGAGPSFFPSFPLPHCRMSTSSYAPHTLVGNWYEDRAHRQPPQAVQVGRIDTRTTLCPSSATVERPFIARRPAFPSRVLRVLCIAMRPPPSR